MTIANERGEYGSTHPAREGVINGILQHMADPSGIHGAVTTPAAGTCKQRDRSTEHWDEANRSDSEEVPNVA